MKQNKIILDDYFPCVDLYIRNMNFVIFFEASSARALRRASWNFSRWQDLNMTHIVLSDIT